MNTKKNTLVAGVIGAVMSPVPALALHMDYYTYGGFEPVRDAFLKIALIFSDPGYIGMMAVCAVIGIIGGGFAALLGVITNPATQGFSLKWAGAALVGIVIFLVFFRPTGSLTIYDPTKNRFHTQDGIPIAVVLLAGVTNTVERGLIDVIDTGSAPDPGGAYSESAGGLGFNLMAQTGRLLIKETGLIASFKRYLDDCFKFEIMRPGTTTNIDDILEGRADMQRWPRLFGQVGGINKVESRHG